MHVFSCGKLAGPTAATGEGLRGIICAVVLTAALSGERCHQPVTLARSAAQGNPLFPPPSIPSSLPKPFVPR